MGDGRRQTTLSHSSLKQSVPVVQHQHRQGPVADNAGQDDQHDDGHPLFALIGRQTGEKYLPRASYKMFSHSFKLLSFQAIPKTRCESRLSKQIPYQNDQGR
jgi:hypothetical protein